MNKIRAKMGKKGGFTLVEMLIVVAIIAILIAISIPVISNALERAKHATDAANERAAKAEVLIDYLAGDGTLAANTTAYYNAKEGKIQAAATGITGYGKHGAHKDQIIAVQIDDNAVVKMTWVATDGTADFNTAKLCSDSPDNVSHFGS